MEDHYQHIDQYFREQLGNYTEQPTPDVWEALEKRLDEKPRRRGIWWLFFVPLFLVATGVTLWFSLDEENKANTKRTIQPPQAVASPGIEKISPDTRMSSAKAPVTTGLATTNRAKKNEQAPKQIMESPGYIPPAGLVPAAPRETAHGAITPQQIRQEKLTKNDRLDPLSSAEKTQLPVNEMSKNDEIKPLLPVEPLPAGDKKMHGSEATSTASATPTEPVAYSDQAPGTTAETPVQQKKLPEAAFTPTRDTIIAIATIAASPVGDTQEKYLHTPVVNKSKSDTPARVKKAFKKTFTAGLKSGYEFGTKPYHANSFVISPYLQYYFSNKFGFLLQPAFKYSHASSAMLFSGTYTQITDSNKTFIPGASVGTSIPLGQDDRFAYQKTYDSIVIKNRLADVKFWNLDLPVMLSYKLRKNFELYGGLNIHITRVARIVSERQTFSGLTKNDTLKAGYQFNSATYDTSTIDKVFQQQGLPLSAYDASAFNNPIINPFKMGVTFGFSYAFRERFLFDIVYRQTLSKLDYIHNKTVRDIYKQPYLRITVGYKFLK